MPRISKVKEIVLKIVEEASKPITAAEVQKKCSKYDRATVYRNLNQLKESQQIRLMEMGDGIVRYESIEDHHHHVICLKCKEIERVDLSPTDEKRMEVMQKEFQKKSKFSLLRHSLEFFGLCVKCTKV